MTDPGQNDKNSNGVEIKRSLPPTPRAAKVFYRRGVPPTTSLSREVCSVLANLMLQSSHLPAGGDRKSVKALNEHFFFFGTRVCTVCFMYGSVTRNTRCNNGRLAENVGKLIKLVYGHGGFVLLCDSRPIDNEWGRLQQAGPVSHPPPPRPWIIKKKKRKEEERNREREALKIDSLSPVFLFFCCCLGFPLGVIWETR